MCPWSFRGELYTEWRRDRRVESRLWLSSITQRRLGARIVELRHWAWIMAGRHERE